MWIILEKIPFITNNVHNFYEFASKQKKLQIKWKVAATDEMYPWFSLKIEQRLTRIHDSRTGFIVHRKPLSFPLRGGYRTGRCWSAISVKYLTPDDLLLW